MTTVNHWGKFVDSESPVTGVLSSNTIAWEWVNDEICLTCEEIASDIESDESIDDDEKANELEFVECDSAHEKIIGDWKQDDKGLYTYDESGEFAAIVRESTVQVIWSKFVTTGALCSPCFPGQVDLNSKGKFKAYTLPNYLLRTE